MKETIECYVYGSKTQSNSTYSNLTSGLLTLTSLTLLRRTGTFLPTRLDLRTDPISPRRPAVSAGLHAADTLWHACIDFLTYSPVPVVWFMSEWGVGSGHDRAGEENMRIYRSLPAVFKWPLGRKRVIQCFVDKCLIIQCFVDNA